ncbi:MAG: hypothetical protein JSW66_20450 [Phycisphaerales bacterium]|nr:MAG: hypothetical protein JSW66_20450 [Phycisphaerales bacterium]
MLEILQNFESTVGEAARLSPGVLIGPGAAAVVVGLFVWLGGLGLRKLFVATAGAIIGGILGFVLIGGGLVPTVVSAVVAAVIARIFEKVFIVVLAVTLAVSIGFAVLAGPYIESPQPANAADPSDLSAGSGTGQSNTSMEELKAYAVDVSRNVKQAALRMPVHRWAIVALLALFYLVGGFTLWRLSAAVCFSALGTMLIFAGMILLLLYKGSEPVSRISGRPLFYAGVCAAMVVFGTFEQLLFCRAAKPQTARKGKAGTQKKASQKKRRSWRAT